MEQPTEVKVRPWIRRPLSAAAACQFLAIGLAMLPPGRALGEFQRIDLSRVIASATNGPTEPSWASLPRGQHTFNGVPFQVDGPMAVTGMDDAREGDFYPTRMANLPVGRKAARLHLLHGANHDDKDGIPMAKVIFHYANGEERSVRLAYGIHARSWVKDRRERNSRLLDANSQQAWNGAGDDTDRSGLSLRLFQTVLPNPLPDQEIVGLEWVSLFSRATPFIAGLTIETGPASEPPAQADSRRTIKRSLELADAVYRDEFVVRVTGEDASRPLTNATAALSITDDEASFYFGEARTDAAGTIRLPYPPQQAVSFALLVRAPGYLPRTYNGSSLNGGEFRREVEARLARGAKLGGLVVDTSGKPVPGAELVLHRITQTGPREYSRIDYATVVAGPDGKWSAESAPSDREAFGLQLAHSDFRPVTYTTVTNQGGAGRTVSWDDLLQGKASLAMTPALKVTGLVQDSSGKAVPNAQVRHFESSRSDAARAVKCDGNGRFAFVVPQPGEVSVIAEAKGFAPKLQRIQVSQDSRSVTLALSPTRPFSGRVVNQSQEPVPGAKVKLDTWNGTRLLKWETLTDGSGRFSWDSPPEGNVMFMVSATNHSTMRTSFSNPSGERILNIRRMSRAMGRVFDAETRKPIEEFTVVKGRSYNAGEPMRWERYDSTRGRRGEYSVSLYDYSGGRSQILIEAPGYQPVASPVFAKAGLYTNDFALQKGKGIRGVVTLADGTPVANATVALVERSDSAYMDRPGELRRSGSGGEFQRSNVKGEFEFQAKLEPHTIFAAHPQHGFAEVRATNVATSGKVVLQAWGRVEGVLRVGKKVEPGHDVVLQNASFRYGEEGRSSAPLYLHLKADPADDGKFSFEKVPPGERVAALQFRLNDRESGRTANSHGVPVTVKPAGTSTVMIGGTGRPIIGRVHVTGAEVQDLDWKRDQHTMQSSITIPVNISPPLITPNMSDGDRQKAFREYNERQAAFWRTEQGRALERQRRSYTLVFENDGSFRVENVEPGTYSVYISPTNPDRGDNYYETIGSMNKTVTVPEAPAGKPDEPFDLGSLDLEVRMPTRTGVVPTATAPKVNRPAPKFEVKTFDDKPVKLEDFKGKHVLIDFWASWAGTRSLDLQMLKSIQDTYGKDPRLVMLGFNFDNQPDTAKKAITDAGIKWTQCYLGPWSGTGVPASFNVRGLPDSLLIDAEGKVLASGLRGTRIRTAVRNALGDAKGASPP